MVVQPVAFPAIVVAIVRCHRNPTLMRVVKAGYRP
jgi:hypothetical protein